jgi:hypothetical protein
MASLHIEFLSQVWKQPEDSVPILVSTLYHHRREKPRDTKKQEHNITDNREETNKKDQMGLNKLPMYKTLDIQYFGEISLH